ncbi:MAG: 16S rRNA (uracil(1498)-N(3))-methyltransferase [Daejeonella sp.]
MHLFYTPQIKALINEEHHLNEEESKHCIKVLRLQKGDEISLINGVGGLYQAIITEPHPKKTQLKILAVQQEFKKRNHYLHIAVAPTKNIERLEWFLEKATEIGIDEISLIICDRSERKEAKTERLLKIITAAVKQSLTAYHPKLNEPVLFRSFIQQSSTKHKFIAHCADDQKTSLEESFSKHSEYLILIGPEGDFTLPEIELALSYNFTPISLGNTRLRTETAALEACFEINYLNR